VPPTLVRPHVAPLEGGRRNPRKRYGCLFRARAGRCRDVRPAGRVFSITSALCGHPRRCAAIPGTAAPSLALWGVGRRNAATPATVRPPAFCQPNPRADVRTTTKQEDPMPPPSKSLLDKHRIRRGAPPEARFTRTVTYSTALYTMPPHVAQNSVARL
jgi:hypothetical protein